MMNEIDVFSHKGTYSGKFIIYISHDNFLLSFLGVRRVRLYVCSDRIIILREVMH